jgi:hypothetical protein
MGNLDASTEASSVDSASMEKTQIPAESNEPETALAEEPAPEAKETGVAAEVQEEKEGDEIEYPAKWRLALITIALCLSVFCMALV